MEAAIRFSQNSSPGSQQRFLCVDVIGKSFRLCEIASQSKKTIKYETVHTTTKVPAFRAFDWHPVNEDLVVVGQAGGEATLLNIAEGHQDSLSFQVRSQRLCNAVALNTQNLLAAGLDKVRTDFCLNIWDFNQRLPAPGSKGFSKNYSDPLHKLASGEPITSLKFFQGDPQLLVAGVKGQFVRLYDLREPSLGNGLQFATRCVHNLAIDWHDENYFASCYPTNDPSICVWDRRMITRLGTTHMSFGGGSHSESRQPEVSLELKNVIETPGTIWSLRFSKAQRGCLGMLSSTGNLKVYNIRKDFIAEAYYGEHDASHDLSWENSPPQDVFLDRAQDLAPQLTDPSAAHAEKSRIVSFDFTTSTTKFRESKLITLDGQGNPRLTSTSPPPEPTALSSAGYLCKGESLLHPAVSEVSKLGNTIEEVRRRAQSRNVLKQAFKQSRQSKTTAETRRMSSLDDQAWHADLGFYEKDVPIPDALTLMSVQRLRCEAGYLLNPTRNKSIVSDSHWLQSFWSWIERASRISKNGSMTQDNFDLSFIGVFGLWMEDVDAKTRTIGPSSNKLPKIIENLVRRLNIPRIKGIVTEYQTNRQVCLHSAGLAWSYEELEMTVKRLVTQNQHTKAAALAIFATERKLAYKALRSKTANQSHKMLAMAIAGASKRDTNEEAGTGDDSDAQDDWADTISSLADELTDPWARAILAYVKTGDWSSVVAEESLPLKYRVFIALRHLDDSKLTRYISQARKDALAAGDIEGVILTGIATPDAFELMTSYLQRFNDLQTAVLALCPAIPRYVDDEKIVRKFSSWKDSYRLMMNSWNLKFDRVRFDIACQNAAIDDAGRRLISPAKEQIRLVCSFCAQNISHLAGMSGGDGPGLGRKSVETPHHPLTKEKAATIGTICPKCGRHLPRCGVCDLWLGIPDESYLSWYKPQHASKRDAGKSSLDLSASMTDSVQTTIGPGPTSAVMRGTESPRPKPSPQSHGHSKASTRTAVPAISAAKVVDSIPSMTIPATSAVDSVADREFQKAEAARKWDAAMSRFTVLCVKCSHGCHSAHARMWFEKHRVCPVPDCRCLCNE